MGHSLLRTLRSPVAGLSRCFRLRRLRTPAAGATRCAVVGAGYLGRFHAEKYAACNDAHLVAVIDTDLARAQKIAQRLGAAAFSDYRCLPQMQVRCASIAVPTSKHYEVAAWLLRQGVDVLVEKPVAVQPEEALELIELARARGRILQIGHLERFNPAFREIEKLLNAPRYFEVRRIAPYRARGADVDVVLDLMIHDIDIVQHLINRPVRQIAAVGVPVLTASVDIANVRLTFEGGAIANLTASRAAYKTERSIRIFQPNVYIYGDYQAKELKIYRRSAAAPAAPTIAVTRLQLEEGDALADEIRSFLRAVATRDVPEVPGEDGLKALQLAARIRAEIHDTVASFEAPGAFNEFQNNAA